VGELSLVILAIKAGSMLASLRKCWVVLKRSPVVYFVAVIVAVCTVLFHIHSYSWSASATLSDVCAAADEGLVSLSVPLTRIAAKETPASDFKIYERGSNEWTTGATIKCPLRDWMNTVGGHHGAMFADFGYWKGDWQSKSRPGPFVVVFVPVWFLGVATFGIFLAFCYRLLQFCLRSLFVVITMTAALLFLLRMRSTS
jgi:hypothetical protein